jgi:hypothetical protein
MQKDIHDIVRNLEKTYKEEVKIGEYVSYSMYDTLQRIQAYLNQKHISGEYDSQDQKKPFDDIITEAVNARERATDVDVSSINFVAPSMKYIVANEIFKVVVNDWMREANFGLFLNDYGRKLAQTSTAIIKAVEKEINGEEKLIIEVLNWNNVIVDPININHAPIVEKLYLTESQLYEKYPIKNVVDLVTTKRKLIDGKQMSNESDFYEIYEVHTKEFNKKVKKMEFKMYIITYLTTKSGEYNDFILYEGKEEKSPYIIAYLTPPDERTLAMGVVEQLFDKQWLVNHYTLITKKQLDFSTKIGFQTSDQSFIGRNVLNDFDTGDILVTKENAPLTQLNSVSSSLTQAEGVKAEIKNSSRTISGVSEAMAGEVKSGAAWRQTEALLQESKDLFSKMKEQKALYLQELFHVHIIPHLIKRIKSKDEISAILDSQGIEKIDSMYITAEAVRRANKKAAQTLLENANKELDQMNTIENLDIAGETDKLSQELKMQGNQRFFKADDDISWDQYFKDFETKVIIDITGEAVDSQKNVETLKSTFGILANNPQVLADPNAKMVFTEILRQTSGISPLQLSTTQAPVETP